MSNILIRRAERSDCPRMMELVHELALYEKAPSEVVISQAHFEESGFGEKPVWWAFVAEVNEAGKAPLVIGFALWYIRFSTWKGQRMYLEDLIVTEDWRGKGIGHMLFDQLISECRELGLAGMNWQVLDWNEPAIRFYRKYEGMKLTEGWLNASLDMKP